MRPTRNGRQVRNETIKKFSTTSSVTNASHTAMPPLTPTVKRIVHNNAPSDKPSFNSDLVVTEEEPNEEDDTSVSNVTEEVDAEEVDARSQGDKSTETSIGTTTTTESTVDIDDTDNTDDVNSRKMNISRWYDKGTTMEKTKESKATVRRAFRNYILPQMKFIKQGRNFGSFEKPDFTNNNCFLNHLFEAMPEIQDQSDRYKACYWNTYKGVCKQQMSQHRSRVTHAQKQNFIKGEFINN